VEGDTEALCLPPFFSRWLVTKIQGPVDIRPVNFQGVASYKRDFAKRARIDLRSSVVAGIIGVIDFYQSGFASGEGTVADKCGRAKAELEEKVGLANFYQHFAVHETEAWLFSDPRIFPQPVQSRLPTTQLPETINTNNPPSRRLAILYKDRLKGADYKKTIDGASLFSKLDPQVAYERCRHLKLLLDDMLKLASVP